MFAKAAFPSLRKLHVVFSTKGAGHTGARLFLRDHVPALKYWNPEAQFSREKAQVDQPVVTVETASNTTKLQVTNKTASQINEEIVALLTK
eukprot:m.31684 g.31684  ORF g.31684 m.31684 type:complete len:91 (-) comp14820_c0_seq1:157-429(-)